jgi:hypothetical protein
MRRIAAVIGSLAIGIVIGASMIPVAAQDGPTHECRVTDMAIAAMPAGALERSILAGEEGELVGSFDDFMPKLATVLGAKGDRYIDLAAACDVWVHTLEPLL